MRDRIRRPRAIRMALLGLNGALASVAIVFTLALTPVTYSLWSEGLSIGGTVETGEFPSDGKWFGYSCNTFPEADESVGWSLRPDADDPLKLDVGLTNGYAGWALYCEIHLANTDGRPLQVVDVQAGSTLPGAATIEWRQDPGDPRKELEPCTEEPVWPIKPNFVSPAQCRQEVQVLIILKQVVAQATFSFTAVLDDPGGTVVTGGLPSLDGLIAAVAEAPDNNMDSVQPIVEDSTSAPESEPDTVQADEESTSEPAPEAPAAEDENSEGEAPPDKPSDTTEPEDESPDSDGASEEPSDSADEPSADPEG